ncbi:MAG: hypothetical protein LUH50_03940 [Bacteroides intestinalis]|nr:hypothetical protein [Bacteroides intestinalis]
MRKILLLCSMVFLCAMLHASVYTFTTNAGVFKLNDQLKTISFKGVEYKITEYKDGGSETNYVLCESYGTSKLFLLDFAKGNISEYNYIETFEWENVAYYNKVKLISGLYRNIDTYISNNNLKGGNAITFRQYANIMIEGIKDGTITMNGDASFTDSTGKLSSSGTFDKTWTGKTKKTQNNALNLVANYIVDYIKQMPTCDSNWEQVGSSYIILKAEKFE